MHRYVACADKTDTPGKDSFARLFLVVFETTTRENKTTAVMKLRTNANYSSFDSIRRRGSSDACFFGGSFPP